MARILVIDDSGEHRQLVVDGLISYGHDVTSAENGVDGLVLFQSKPFDLVVTDVLMPGADGLEVIRSILNTGKNVPVIAMSGGSHSFPAAISLSASRAFGAVAVLYKPFRMAELRDAVARALVS